MKIRYETIKSMFLFINGHINYTIFGKKLFKIYTENSNKNYRAIPVASFVACSFSCIFSFSSHTEYVKRESIIIA